MEKLDFTFCALDLDISDVEITSMLKEIKTVKEDFWYKDNFRGCYILPLINGGGTTGAPPKGVMRDEGNMVYTEAIKNCNLIEDVILQKIFPFMGMKTRVSVLRTKKDHGLNVHVDSGKHRLNTIQHKFRIVLNGEIDKLFFLDENNEKIFAPNDYNSYVLDGTHPHAIDPGKEEKITICFGTPWTGNETVEYNKLIQQSPHKFKINKPKILDEWIK